MMAGSGWLETDNAGRILMSFPIRWMMCLIVSMSLQPCFGQERQIIGADYAWYRVTNCNRSDYSVLVGYRDHRSEVRSQLQAMFSNGLRILRIPLFHSHSDTQGVVRSTGHGLPDADLENVKDLLADIRGAGFSRIEFGMFPTAGNIPWQWQTWDESLYRENLAVVRQMHTLLQQSNLKYVIDLMNEGIPTPEQTMMLRYDKTLWHDYVDSYGIAATVGFSIDPDPKRIAMLGAVYGATRPKLLDLHFYHNFPAMMAEAKSALAAQGMDGTPWIIGETYYGSKDDIDQIERTARAIDQTVQAVIQWPLDHRRACPDVDIVPLDRPK